MSRRSSRNVRRRGSSTKAPVGYLWENDTTAAVEVPGTRISATEILCDSPALSEAASSSVATANQALAASARPGEDPCSEGDTGFDKLFAMEGDVMGVRSGGTTEQIAWPAALCATLQLSFNGGQQWTGAAHFQENGLRDRNKVRVDCAAAVARQFPQLAIGAHHKIP